MRSPNSPGIPALRWRLALGIAFCIAVLPAATAGDAITREGDRWVRVIEGEFAPRPRLQVESRGPVSLQGNTGKTVKYSVKLSVRSHSEETARRLLESYQLGTATDANWIVFSAGGWPGDTEFTIRAPRLEQVAIAATEGKVNVSDVDGPVTVQSGGGELTADRIGGPSSLFTGEGSVHVGHAAGAVQVTTGYGGIYVTSAAGDGIFQTMGGDIVAGDIAGAVRATTAAGLVRIASAGGAVEASTGAGQVNLGRINGPAIVRNGAGPVHVDSASGVQCESSSGAIQLGPISGMMQVQTRIGDIIANLVGAHPADSFLGTGNGDITVWIPSDLGVNIQAENQMADTLGRIKSDFQEVPVRRKGVELVAEGAVNGGGPLLRISAVSGTIYIRRQR